MEEFKKLSETSTTEVVNLKRNYKEIQEKVQKLESEKA